MKSNRVNLEDPNNSEKIANIMIKLREKYVNCENIKVSFDESSNDLVDENTNPNQISSRSKIYKTPLQVPKSVHEIKSADLHETNNSVKSNPISKFSEKTNEETEEKNFPYKENYFLVKTEEKEKSASHVMINNENLFLSKLNKETEKKISFEDEKSQVIFQNKNREEIDLLLGKEGEKFLAHPIKSRSQEHPRNFHTFYNWIGENQSPDDLDSSQTSSGIYLDDYSEDEFSDNSLIEEELFTGAESSVENILIRSPSVAGDQQSSNPEEKSLLHGKLTFKNIKFNNNNTNNVNSVQTYKKFGLSLRIDMPHSPSSQTHRFLPLKYKNDEKYKARLFKFLRKPQNPHNRTETCKFQKFRKHSEHFDGNMSKYYDSLGMKMRKVSSEKKVYEAHHLFEDNRAYVDDRSKHPPQYFKFYSDKDIGFTAKWQVQLKATEMDDDVETDEDQLNAADRHIKREIGEGIRSFIKNRKNVRNFTFLNIY